MLETLKKLFCINAYPENADGKTFEEELEKLKTLNFQLINDTDKVEHFFNYIIRSKN